MQEGATHIFVTNHHTQIHELLASVSLAVICKGERVSEAHHGAAQGERLRLRDLQPTLRTESHIQRSPGHPQRAVARPRGTEVRLQETAQKHVPAHIFVCGFCVYSASSNQS